MMGMGTTCEPHVTQHVKVSHVPLPLWVLGKTLNSDPSVLSHAVGGSFFLLLVKTVTSGKISIFQQRKNRRKWPF